MHLIQSALLLLCCLQISFTVDVFGSGKLIQDKENPYDPPSYQDKAKRARYLVHYVNWGILGTISTHYNRNGMPFTNIATISDGPVGKSTGIPYFYIMNWDISAEDIMKNNSVSLTVSEMETDYCKNLKYNPELPLCTRVTLCGKFVKITDAADKKFALNALFSRNPDMKKWPSSHNFYPARLNIELVWMIDYFGNSTIVPVSKYFAADLQV